MVSRRVIFTLLGTGSSRGTPTIEKCLLDPSLVLTAELRHNPSLLVQVVDTSMPAGPNAVKLQLLVDMGKTFRFSIMDHLKRCVQHAQTPDSKLVFPFLRPAFDGVFITHGHADAMGGLDDLRELNNTSDCVSMPVYADRKTMGDVSSTFPYMFSTSSNGLYLPSASPIAFDYFQEIKFLGGSFSVIPVPTTHGNVTCSGFVFRWSEKHGVGGAYQAAYFSDFHCPPISPKVIDFKNRSAWSAYAPLEDFLTCFAYPEETIRVLKECPLHHLVLDTLSPDFFYPSHACFFEAEKVVDAIMQAGVSLSNCRVCNIGMSAFIDKEWYSALDPPSRICVSHDGDQFVLPSSE
ncbi:mitochondrial uncharacterized hydrolase [Andalucia godoyi]|uniref:Mitochondrial uncharacterized hydrolase n=1 Tax=Andalucia godoyi TaxID=505711 RepID=A0A8K0AHY8_ANDGO|nr:mitochondrial uncharacterized hydrolase [Andalucia godoyi]|eukprot:ANDGO_05605.mRNA.1 mitochondrial uncharacterized hydrolase